MKHIYSARELEYFFDHGWQISSDGMLTLTARQAGKHTSKSIRFPDKRTLLAPTDTGLALLIEDRHFIVTK